MKHDMLKETGFTHCPKCASQDIMGQNNAMVCAACGYKLFFNCAATASCLIQRDGCLLMVVRKKDPGKGMLDLPGGFVDYGESLEKAAERELMEEIGVTPTRLDYLTSAPNDYPYKNVLYHTCDSFFTAELPDDATPVAGDDAESLAWIPLSEIDETQIAFEPAKVAIRVLKQQITRA